MELLEVNYLGILIGLEIEDTYDRERIGRFIGNFLSRDLFIGKKWCLLVKGEKHLFNIKDVKEYLG